MKRPSSPLLRARIAALTLGMAAMSPSPAAADNVLRYISFAGGAVTIDPHSWLWPENRTAMKQVYEGLLDVDSNLAIVPQLAVAWKPLDPNRWEFKLRRDVRFHDGAPFTAEDVVFSLERARAATSDIGFVADLGRVSKVAAVDDHTVLVILAAPDPALWLKLAHVAIMSKAWAERHGVTAPANFEGAREETYASRHANGTGPFVLESFEPGGAWVMVRNSDWWGSAEYPHNIDRIVHTWVDDPQRHLEALLRGDADLLQNPPYEALARIRATPGLKVATGMQLSGVFLGMDQGRAELRSSDVGGKNPFKDKRVRQAMYHAIDTDTILRPLMEDLAVPAGMLIPPGVNGYTSKMDQRLAFDPETAKALLAEAGYPNGFSVILDCTNDWGDDEMTTCTGAAEQLTAVGIEARVNFMPSDAWSAKVYKDRQSDFWLDIWFTEPDTENVLRSLFHSRSSDNFTGYANSQVDELIDTIETEMVTYVRDGLLEKAWQMVIDDVVYLPVRHPVTVWAMRDDLEIPVDPRGVPRFRLARLKHTRD